MLRSLALLAARAAACTGAIALSLPLTLLIALAGLTILAGLLGGRGLAGLVGLLAGLGLWQLLDRARQIIERFSRVLPALPQSIGTLVELVCQLRVAAGDLLGSILQRISQIVARGLGELAGLIG
jgi:hypothetical protein